MNLSFYLQILLIGTLIFLSILWQRYVFGRDYKIPLRIKGALIVGAVLLLGIITHQAIELFLDEKSTLSYEVAQTTVIKTFILCVLFVVKSYFGPFTIGITLSALVYFYGKYGIFNYVDLMTLAVDQIFSVFPEEITLIYAIVSAIVIIGGSLTDSFNLSLDSFELNA